ncbi:MAG: DUF4292 domain-containing protein [Muribaculaceae bacterium]|nr:DUF4292 domain-containing protein [Muribaculaceae bacterium]
MIKKLSLVMSVVLITVFLTGCRSKKVAESAEPQHWTTFSAPVKLKLETPKRMSISGRCSMEYGKSISLSVRMLGMEVATIYVTPDSVFAATTKFQKYYMKESLSSVLDDNYVPFEGLQDLLAGDPDKVAWIADAVNYKAVNDEKAGTLTISADVELRTNISGQIIWDMSAARWNEPVDVSWREPRDCKLVKGSDVWKLIQANM